MSLCNYSPPSFSAAAADVSLAPAILMPTCSHYQIPTHAPFALSNPSHRYSSDSVAM